MHGTIMYILNRTNGLLLSATAYSVFITGPIIMPCMTYRRKLILVSRGVGFSIFRLNNNDTR